MLIKIQGDRRCNFSNTEIWINYGSSLAYGLNEQIVLIRKNEFYSLLTKKVLHRQSISKRANKYL